MSIRKSLLTVAAAALFASGSVQAAPDQNVGAGAKGTLILSSPPRESAEEAARTYQPLADYLSKVTGKRVVFKYPRTWGAYRTEMLMGNYDILFDGPHFVSYRVQRLNHNVLAKLNDERRGFSVIVRKDEKTPVMASLSGRTVCTQSPPNLGALVLLSQFTNAAQQPVLVPEKGWPKIYEGVLTGRCTAGILPGPNLKALDKDGVVKVVYESQIMPDQAFTAGPRVSADDQKKIVAALLSPQAAGPTEKLRDRFKGGDGFVAGNNTDYNGIADFLRQEWGFF